MPGREEGRKVRSDKKRQVKALIASEIKEVFHRICHITNTPMKDTCEFLTVCMLDDTDIIDQLSKYFARAIPFEPTLYNANPNGKRIEKRLDVESDIVSIFFKQPDYDRIATLAYALDLTPTRTTAVLLEIAAYNIKAVNEYVYINMTNELTEGQIKELRKVLSFVNQYNTDNSSWLSLLSRIIGDVRPASKKLFDLVNEFLKVK